MSSNAYDAHQARTGLIYGLIAYLTWGFAPIYFKQLSQVAPIQILAHRMAWSVLFIALLLAWQKRFTEVRAVLRSPKVLATLFVTAILVSANWFIFIFAIANGHIVDCSLGYFINPLLSVLLGVIFLRERLRTWQLAALLLAGSGVAYLIFETGVFPWIALTLAATFGTYGLLRKTVAAAPLVGLAVETVFLLPLAMALIGSDLATSPDYAVQTWLLLPLAGIITALPLLWFANAAKRLRLSTIGFIQYLTPTCQFLVGALMYREPVDPQRLTAFVIVWIACGLYLADSIRAMAGFRPVQASKPGVLAE